MIPRLRMLAGPNGSGKSTLARQLTDDYAVNLYKYLNADMLFAEISQSCKTACPISTEHTFLITPEINRFSLLNTNLGKVSNFTPNLFPSGSDITFWVSDPTFYSGQHRDTPHS